MHTRMCRKYPITHVNIQEHLIYSNCHTPIYILKKKTHFHAQSVASNFTPNLYPKHLLSQTTDTHSKYIYHTNFHCFTHIYAYWQDIYIMHILAFKRESRAIIHSFRKWPQYSFTLCKEFHALYIYLCIHTVARYFPRYLYVKYQTWGSPNSSKNSHKQVLIFMFF